MWVFIQRYKNVYVLFQDVTCVALDEGSLKITSVMEFQITSEQEDQEFYIEIVDRTKENMNTALSETDLFLTIDGTTLKDNNDHDIQVTEMCQQGQVKIQLIDEQIICRKSLKNQFCHSSGKTI